MEEAFQLDWVKLPVRLMSGAEGGRPVTLRSSLTHFALLPFSPLQSPAVTLVRESCAAFLSSSPDVSVDSAALTSFVSRLRARGALEAAPTRQFPLNFPTPRSEINFIATLALLQIGSGYRTPLHAQERGQGRGAAETMMFGCMGMHISGEITADAMVAVGLFDVAQMFGLKIQEEYEISTGVRCEPVHIACTAQHAVIGRCGFG